MRDRDVPMKVVKEELGGDYYFRCPWIACNEVVKSEFNYCPNCGQRLDFQVDDIKRFRDNMTRFGKGGEVW